MISPEDLHLQRITDRVEEAVEDVTGFYRVFQRMEYLSDKLVFHLQQAPSEQQLATIRREFGDIVVDGVFELLETTTASENSADEVSVARLAFRFNRRNHGRLRQLIDWINVEVR